VAEALGRFKGAAQTLNFAWIKLHRQPVIEAGRLERDQMQLAPAFVALQPMHEAPLQLSQVRRCSSMAWR
jgi:hypothetical protein